MKTRIKRRKQCKTDYKKRIELLKSGKPRVVFRKSNKYFVSQYVESNQAQDKIILGVNSKNLLTKGWPEKAKGSLKSLSAAYLTGYLIGKQIIRKKLETPVCDFGMVRMLHGSKVFAFLKGMIDAGVKIKCEKGFPDEERIKGRDMKEKIDFQKIKSEIDKVQNGRRKN